MAIKALVLLGLVALAHAGGPAHYATSSGAIGVLDGSQAQTQELTQKGIAGDSLSSYTNNIQGVHSFSSNSISRGTGGAVASAAPALGLGYSSVGAPAFTSSSYHGLGYSGLYAGGLGYGHLAAPAVHTVAAAPAVTAVRTVATPALTTGITSSSYHGNGYTGLYAGGLGYGHFAAPGVTAVRTVASPAVTTGLYAGGLGYSRFAAPAVHTVAAAPAVTAVRTVAAPAVTTGITSSSYHGNGYTGLYGGGLGYGHFAAPGVTAVRTVASPAVTTGLYAGGLGYSRFAAPAVHTVAAAPAVTAVRTVAAPAVTTGITSSSYHGNGYTGLYAGGLGYGRFAAPAVHTVATAPAVTAVRTVAAAPAVAAVRTVAAPAFATGFGYRGAYGFAAPAVSYATPAFRTVASVPAVRTVAATPAVAAVRTVSPAFTYAAPAVRTVAAAPAVAAVRTVSPAFTYAAPAVRTVAAAPAVAAVRTVAAPAFTTGVTSSSYHGNGYTGLYSGGLGYGNLGLGYAAGLGYATHAAPVGVAYSTPAFRTTVAAAPALTGVRTVSPAFTTYAAHATPLAYGYSSGPLVSHATTYSTYGGTYHY